MGGARGWHPGVSLCQAVWFLRELSEGGEEEESRRHALLQHEQMAESESGDLFYISIPCRGAVDVGFRFLSFLFFLPLLLQMLSYRVADARNV